MSRVAIGIGSNQGDSIGNCRDAIKALQNHSEVNILNVSSIYRTKPVGVTEQSWFINAVALCETLLSPLALLRVILDIEKDFGRVRTIRWGPRTLDLDILFYDDLRLDLPGLKVPHPRMHERLFVLAPLAETDPNWRHPELGISVTEMLDRLLQTDHHQVVFKLES